MFYFIVDPNVRRGLGEKFWNRVERRLKKQGIAYESFMAAKSGDAREFSHQLGRECMEPGVLVTVGGIGTLNEVVNGLSLDAPLSLAYIPVEPANDLTRALRLPRSLKKQLRRATGNSAVRYADYGILAYEEEEPAHRRFLLDCSIGVDVAACRSILEEEHPVRPKIPGSLKSRQLRSALEGAVRQMRARPVRGFLMLDGEKKVEFNRIYFISVRLYPLNGGFRSHIRAEENEGFLEVCVVHGLSRLLLLPVVLDYWTGRRRLHKGMRFYRCRELQIHVDEPLPVHVDGESCCSQTDISLSCIRKKLRFL